MSTVRTLRWSEEINTLDARVDYERICVVLSVYEFSWDMENSLEFVLFRTYAVLSISALLSAFDYKTPQAHLSAWLPHLGTLHLQVILATHQAQKYSPRLIHI